MSDAMSDNLPKEEIVEATEEVVETPLEETSEEVVETPTEEVIE